MHVNCPNCGEVVTAEHINIQKMTAVCSACNSVFSFELSEDKAKRRKVKQPAKLTLRDTETLQMEFWTNFRLDKNEAFISSVIGSAGMAIVGLLLIDAPDVPRIMPLGFFLLATVLFYGLALTILNKTQIEMDEDAIRVTRKPFRNPLNQGYEVSLAGVTAIKYEETAASQKEAYDTPRYRVWAETADGSRRMIINDVTEEYAVFITQRLQERLPMDDNLDVSRLEDDEYLLNDDVERVSQNKVRHSSK